MVERIKKIDLFTINYILLFLLGTINLINGIAKSKGIFYYISYSMIFYIFGIITFICKHKKCYKWNAILYGIIGLLTTFFGYEGNFSGSIFICFSVYIFNTQKTNVIMIVSTIMVLTAKFAFNAFIVGEIVNIFIAYGLVFIIYYILIHPKKPHIITNFSIDYENQKILELLAAGYSNKEIADKVFISANAVTKRLMLLRIKFDSKTNCQLVYKISTKGYYRHE